MLTTLRRLRRAAGGQDGSALLLMPAAVLILFMLAGVAVDAAVQFLGQRRVADLAASVAQDAVASVDLDRFYAEGELAIDPGGATARQHRLIGDLPSDDAFLAPSCDVEVVGVEATASCRAQVRLIFSGIVPGAATIREVTAVETAEGQQAP